VKKISKGLVYVIVEEFKPECNELLPFKYRNKLLRASVEVDEYLQHLMDLLPNADLQFSPKSLETLGDLILLLKKSTEHAKNPFFSMISARYNGDTLKSVYQNDKRCGTIFGMILVLRILVSLHIDIAFLNGHCQ
jgi:hypothetical protein